MKQLTTRLSRLTMATSALVVLGACASAPTQNAALDDAKAAYDRAAGDAHIVRSAPVELRKAQQALQKAETAMQSGEDTPSIDYYAELAKKRTEVAVEAGKVAKAEQAVASAGLQRDRIMIESRTQEANNQRALAEKAGATAETQRNDAEEARKQAEAARKLAEERLAVAQASQAQTASARARAKSLEDQLAEMKAKKTPRGMVLTLGDVLFDTGSAELKPGAYRTLDQLAAFLKENPERNVEIEGHTDSVGSDALNQILSERRAMAVKTALMQRGLAEDRASAKGLGKSTPVAGNETAAGRQQNRRVEIVVSDKP